MEEHIEPEKQLSSTEKKEWIKPEMKNIPINSGVVPNINEGSTSGGFNGTMPS